MTYLGIFLVFMGVGMNNRLAAPCILVGGLIVVAAMFL